MKSLSLLVLGLSLVTNLAQARSLHPDTFRGEVAPVLSEIEVTKVAKYGEVLKSSHRRPFSNFLIAIPVSVNPGSACTSFVGQQISEKVAGNGKVPTIRMMGASDPVQDACIAVMPAPVKTQLTFNMQVLTGGFVPADDIQRQLVQIMPLGLYSVTLNMGNQSVTVEPVLRHNR